MLAHVSAEIIEGGMYAREMYIVIKDYIGNYFKGICAISNREINIGIHCVSNSGPLYTEAQAADTLIRNFHIERMYQL